MKRGVEIVSGSNYGNALFACQSMQLSKSRPIYDKYPTICYASGFNSNNNEKFDVTSKMLTMKSKSTNSIKKKQLNTVILLIY